MAFDNNMDINPERMNSISNEIQSTGKKYQEKVTEIYNKIVEMNNYWQGEEYNVVKTKFEQSKPALEELGVLVNQSIPKDINTAVENYTNTQNKIRNMFS